MSDHPKKTPGEKACDAFAAHLVSVPIGGVICGGGLSTSWSQYSELGKAAWEAAADVIRTATIEECVNTAGRTDGHVSCDDSFERGYDAGRVAVLADLVALVPHTEGKTDV